MKKVIKVWLTISLMAIQTQLTTGWASLLFVVGKILRFFFFFMFIFSILSKANTLAGYNQQQVILFFLVFNLIDISTQVLFRGVYRFRPLIVRGDFDLVLLQPVPSFFRPIFGWTDLFDFLTLIPLWIYFLQYVFRNNLFAGLASLIMFLLLFFNSLILSFAFHLFVCSICVLTTEVDHLVMVYRDLTNMARFPTDIYQSGIRFLLTFVVPVIVLMTIPVKILLGFLNWQTMIASISGTILFLYLSVRFWKYGLKNYSSASS